MLMDFGSDDFLNINPTAHMYLNDKLFPASLVKRAEVPPINERMVKPNKARLRLLRWYPDNSSLWVEWKTVIRTFKRLSNSRELVLLLGLVVYNYVAQLDEVGVCVLYSHMR